MVAWPLSTVLLAGCGTPTGSSVELPNVDPQTAAAKALEVYDKDGSGSLDDAELAACPAIFRARNQYDQNADAQISQEELATRLQELFGRSVGLLTVDCVVTRQGRPLSGATVKLTPEPFLGESIQAAVGTTDENGTAIPGIPAEELPAALQREQLMQPGIYRVEVEHHALPAGSGPYGAEVDPSRRDGTTVRIEL